MHHVSFVLYTGDEQDTTVQIQNLSNLLFTLQVLCSILACIYFEFVHNQFF